MNPPQPPDRDRPKRRGSAPVELIDYIVAILLAIGGAVGAIIEFMPSFLDSTWMAVGTIIVAIGALFVARVLCLLPTLFTKALNALLAATGVMILGAVIGVLLVLWYTNAADRFTVAHEGATIVIGSEYQPEVAKQIELWEREFTVPELLRKLPETEPEEIWTPASIASRKLALRALFLLSMGAMVMTVVFAAFALPLLVRRFKPTRDDAPAS